MATTATGSVSSSAARKPAQGTTKPSAQPGGETGNEKALSPKHSIRPSSPKPPSSDKGEAIRPVVPNSVFEDDLDDSSTGRDVSFEHSPSILGEIESRRRARIIGSQSRDGVIECTGAGRSHDHSGAEITWGWSASVRRSAGRGSPCGRPPRRVVNMDWHSAEANAGGGYCALRRLRWSRRRGSF